MEVRSIDLKTGKETSREMTAAEIKSLQPSPEQIRQERIAKIKSRLNEIDQVESIRPMRSILKGVGTDFDIQKIGKLDVEAETLREELRALENDSNPS